LANVIAHLETWNTKGDEEDVLTFHTEDALFERMDNSEHPKPIMVKFFEPWCTHCRMAKPVFIKAATYFKDRVEFMEVQCSKDAETQAFCSRNQVQSYPQFVLFTGEEKIPFKAEERSIQTFQLFFDKHLPKDSASMSPTKSAETTSSATIDANNDNPHRESKSTATPIPTDSPNYSPSSSCVDSSRLAALEQQMQELKSLSDDHQIIIQKLRTRLKNLRTRHRKLARKVNQNLRDKAQILQRKDDL